MDISWTWLSLLAHVLSAMAQQVVKDTLQGQVRGKQTTVQGVQLDVFLGIPFAKPPLGDLRFQRPQPVENWHDVINATTRSPSCHQAIDSSFDRFSGVEMWNANTNRSENCLYLNIWAPSATSFNTKRAVLIWIYGGGFYGGSATLDLYDGSTLAAVNDVIVVSMQYRVGPLGFLYLGRDEVPGNVGLLDQQMAIEWVFNNIDKFGGDKKRLTLFGESAGSASVSAHLLSPLSQKLVRYAIMQSGIATARWATENRQDAINRAYKIAEGVGCKERNNIVKCLREADANDLVNSMWNVGSDNLVTPISAVVDGHFLKEDPAKTIAKGQFKKTNILLGAMKNEGSYFLVYAFLDTFKLNRTSGMTPEEVNKTLKAVARTGNPLTDEAVRFEYLNPLTAEPAGAFDQMLGDADFLCPTTSFADSYAADNQKVFLYHFLHHTSGNPWPKWMGVMHGYEIDHVFGVPLRGAPYTAKEAELSRRIMAYWTNFAKTG